jgi:hypothetical protein
VSLTVDNSKVIYALPLLLYLEPYTDA